MDTSVRRLDEVGAADWARAGGKAAKLGELAAQGFPVPAGFVVLAEACRLAFDALSLRPRIEALDDARPADRARLCEAIQQQVVAAEIDADLADAIRAAHARLTAGRALMCAVRSSATAEDLADASFAGQHRTYYYVDADRLLEMVQRCWASLFELEAVSYRATHGIPHSSVSMAVLVQEMVPADVSGVAFTANPVSGATGEIVIEASWGMGAAIVDGRVTPDRYVVRRQGLEIAERRVSEKRFMVSSSRPDDHVERLVAVPPERRRQATLQPAEVRTVAEWALRCEERFGGSQDVEWAFADGRFHLLQARPVTGLARVEIGRGIRGKHVLFKALAENFTDPLTPLTADLIRPLPPGMRLVGGRIYFDLAHIRALLPLDLSDEELAEFAYAGGRPRVPLRLAFARLPATALVVLIGYLALAVSLARSRNMPDDFMSGYRARCREVEDDPGLGPGPALRRLWLLPGLLDPIGLMVLFVNLSALRFVPWVALLGRMLRRWVPDAPPDAATLLCSGSEGVLSAEMGRGIWGLARTARTSERVKEIVARCDPAAALARLRQEPASRPFLDELAGFLEVHGHRAVREFELRSPRWDEDPSPILGMIRNYLLIEADPGELEAKAAHAREALEERIRHALASRPLESLLGPRWALLGLAARRARYYLKLRENSRFHHIMALRSVRRKVLAIEQELLKRGRLRCKDDVFFLREQELDGLRAGRLAWPDVEERIRQRRIEHVRLAKVTPPRTLGIERAQLADEAADAERLSGQPASPGRYRGTARVVLDAAADVTLRPGEILVAPFTDPAWTPLFLTAGAAVVEVGSYLSHAGTVAREFGMPCVVDVAECTRRIQTGFELDVDGSAGSVRILSRGRVA